MRVDIDSPAFGSMAFLGMLLGFALLFIGLLGEGQEALGVAGLALTFAGLLYGLR
jgi:hypothetical protein